MQSSRFLGAALAAILLSATAAVAFSTDDNALNDANGASRFSDPDEQMPSQVFTVGGHTANYGEQDNGSNGQFTNYGPSAAPFSPSNNNYFVPRH